MNMKDRYWLNCKGTLLIHLNTYMDLTASQTEEIRPNKYCKLGLHNKPQLYHHHTMVTINYAHGKRQRKLCLLKSFNTSPWRRLLL